LIPLSFFLFHAPATPYIYPLSLHDALPIYHEGGFFVRGEAGYDPGSPRGFWEFPNVQPTPGPVDWHNIKASQGDAASPGSESASDRKSTRLNSSHSQISYAVFCLKKKKKKK